MEIHYPEVSFLLSYVQRSLPIILKFQSYLHASFSSTSFFLVLLLFFDRFKFQRQGLFSLSLSEAY